MGKKILVTASVLAVAVLVVVAFNSANSLRQIKDQLTGNDGGSAEIKLEQSRDLVSSDYDRSDYTSDTQDDGFANISDKFRNTQSSNTINSNDANENKQAVEIDPHSVAALNPRKISSTYLFRYLKTNDDGKLRLNQNTIGVLTRLYNTQSIDDLQPHLDKIKKAAGYSLSEPASEEFVKLVETFGNFYKAAIWGEKPFNDPDVDVDPSASLVEKMHAYQDHYFGKEVADELFYLEREYLRQHDELKAVYGNEIPQEELQSLNERIAEIAKEQNS